MTLGCPQFHGRPLKKCWGIRPPAHPERSRAAPSLGAARRGGRCRRAGLPTFHESPFGNFGGRRRAQNIPERFGRHESGARSAPNRSQDFRAGFWIPKKPFRKCPGPFWEMQKSQGPQKFPKGALRETPRNFLAPKDLSWNRPDAKFPKWEFLEGPPAPLPSSGLEPGGQKAGATEGFSHLIQQKLWENYWKLLCPHLLAREDLLLLFLS